jgi:transcriptional regulator with XRE-family HTH domain
MDASIVQRIEELCAEKEITMTYLESSTKIAQGSIRSWGRIKPSIDKIISVAKFFNVSTDYLLGLSGSRYSVEAEESDAGLVSLKRARSKMTSEERKDMDALMEISFKRFFKEGSNESD